MSTLPVRIEALAVDVTFSDNALHVVLADGRELSAPLDWFPRLRRATAKQRKKWRLIGDGVGIHWPDVDEDISVDSLFAQRLPGPQNSRVSAFHRLAVLRQKPSCLSAFEPRAVERGEGGVRSIQHGRVQRRLRTTWATWPRG